MSYYFNPLFKKGVVMIKRSYLLVGIIAASSGLLFAHCGKCVEDSCPACSKSISNPETPVMKKKACTCKKECSCKKMDCKQCRETGCSCFYNAQERKEKKNKIRLAVGEKHTITLPTNPSTGYQWIIKSMKKNPAATATLMKIEYPEKVMPGTPGTQPIEIVAVKKGKTILILEYKGPGKKGEVAKTKEYVIKVSEKE
jgi:predicted secreted protein